MEDLTVTIPPEIVTTPVNEWQLNLVTLTVIIMVLGRVWKAIANSGGLIGIWKSLVFGYTPNKDSNPKPQSSEQHATESKT